MIFHLDHVARLHEDTPANKLLRYCVNLTVGRPPRREWKRCKWIDQIWKNSNNYTSRADLWRNAIMDVIIEALARRLRADNRIATRHKFPGLVVCLVEQKCLFHDGAERWLNERGLFVTVTEPHSQICRLLWQKAIQRGQPEAKRQGYYSGAPDRSGE